MYETFGQYDSAEELNATAEGLKTEGDLESLKILASENGISTEDAEDYMDGIAQEFATPLIAALGKLDVEEEDLKPYEIMRDWVDYIRVRCTEDKEMRCQVMRKDKSLKGCIAALLSWSFKNQYSIPQELVKLVGVKAGKVTLGIPGMEQAKKIITKYYVGK